LYRSEIDNSEETREHLFEGYNEVLRSRDLDGQYTVEGAEEVFNAYTKIQDHKILLGEYATELVEVTEIIIAYLKAVKGGRIELRKELEGLHGH
jgi:hypothetical protein